MSCHPSNNKYFDCPPRMHDGRNFTDYRPSCDVNNQYVVNGNVLTSYEYRMYLTKNAVNLMDQNRQNACDKNCCGPCMPPYDIGTMLPEKNLVKCNKSTCEMGLSYDTGLGTGRVYSDFDRFQVCDQWKQWTDQLGGRQGRCNQPTQTNMMNRYTVPGGAKI